jgi:hypothetical protein
MLPGTTSDRILALYDRALDGCLERNGSQVSDALVGLIGSLDFNANGTAEHFYRLYDFCLWRSRDRQFDKVMWILSDLRDTWARHLSEQRPRHESTAESERLELVR